VVPETAVAGWQDAETADSPGRHLANLAPSLSQWIQNQANGMQHR